MDFSEIKTPNLVISAQIKLRRVTLMPTRGGMYRSGGGSRDGAFSICVDAAVRNHAVRVIGQSRLVALVILVDCGAERRKKMKICRRSSSVRLDLRYRSHNNHDQTLVQTCATLAINGRSRLSGRGDAVPMLHRDSGGWLGAAVMMQGGSYLGGHSSKCGATVRGTQAAVVATSWSSRVWNERSSGTGSGRRHQTGLLTLRRLRRGSVISPRSVVGSWSGVWWMLLVVLDIRWGQS